MSKFKKKNIIIIAPHPDDETLGCGGTILRYLEQKQNLFWVIITKVKINNAYDKYFVKKRKDQIKKVKKEYNFKKIFQLNIEPSAINKSNSLQIIKKIKKIFNEVKPNIIFSPYENDVHTDHQILSTAIQSNIKWFRQSNLNEVFLYETLSETNFNRFSKDTFRPNTYINISKFINKKMSIMKIYKSEIKKHPFPRSLKAIKSLAVLRGSESGFNAAEAFISIYKSIK